MSAGEVLFQGTWEEAIRRADDIHPGTQVLIVKVASEERQVSKEQLRATFEHLVNEARRLDAEARAQGLIPAPSDDDPYTQILVEKLRKQGLRLE